VVLCALLSSVGRGDIIIANYSAATNDRFTNNAAFVGNPFNFSGVGQTSSGLWATAISRNVVLSANHAAPSGNIFFYADNNPASVPVVVEVASGQKIPNTDLYIAKLKNALPSSILHYSFATEFLTTATNAGVYQDMEVFMVGRSPAANPASRDQAVGRNKVSGYFENVSFLGNSNADMLYMVQDDASSADFVQYEAYLQGGDSGGPLFAGIAGQLKLLGTNAGITLPPDPPPFLSAINYTGNQAAFINAFINLNAVPEPSSALFVLVSGMALAITRRRKINSPTLAA
jgi:hypothetical protein